MAVKNIFTIASVLWFVVGCDQQVAVSPASLLQTPSSNPALVDCSSAVIPHQYIVKWKSGAISRETANDDQTFIDGFLTAYKDQIDFAEPDHTVSVPEKAQSMLAVQPVTEADNWGVIKVNADLLWQQGDYGAGVTVAVVDTGIDRTHPQLAQQLYMNPGENGTDAEGRNKATNGIDDDNNGYIDDWDGWNWVAGTNSPLDDYGHGTHVSGIIAAQHADTVAQLEPYVQGMAPKAKIMPLKFLDDTGSGAISNAVLAIQYAVMQGAQVINASWGGTDCSASLEQEIQALVSKNILFVAASGNDSVDLDTNARYPASFSFLSQITVGATGQFDSMADYSNYGTQVVKLFAPGTLIISTFPGGEMAALSGTSMATPFVAGAAALLYGVHPTATLSQVQSTIGLSILKNTQYLNETQGRLDLTTMLANFR